MVRGPDSPTKIAFEAAPTVIFRCRAKGLRFCVLTHASFTRPKSNQGIKKGALLGFKGGYEGT